MVTLKEYDDLIADRPEKFTPEDVVYEQAPEGSAMRCAACHNLYRRTTDNFTVCQVMRSDQTDLEGVWPDYRCRFFTVDDDVFPLYEPEEAR